MSSNIVSDKVNSEWVSYKSVLPENFNESNNKLSFFSGFYAGIEFFLDHADIPAESIISLLQEELNKSIQELDGGTF